MYKSPLKMSQIAMSEQILKEVMGFQGNTTEGAMIPSFDREIQNNAQVFSQKLQNQKREIAYQKMQEQEQAAQAARARVQALMQRQTQQNMYQQPEQMYHQPQYQGQPQEQYVAPDQRQMYSPYPQQQYQQPLAQPSPYVVPQPQPQYQQPIVQAPQPVQQPEPVMSIQSMLENILKGNQAILSRLDDIETSLNDIKRDLYEQEYDSQEEVFQEEIKETVSSKKPNR